MRAFRRIAVVALAAWTVALSAPQARADVTSPGQEVTVTVLPSLTFVISAVAGNTVCGDLTTNVTSATNSVNLGALTGIQERATAGQNLTVVTNVPNGYTVSVAYDDQLTGGESGNEFDDIAGTNAAPVAWPADGAEAFGYTTSDDSLSSGMTDRFDGRKFAALTQLGSEVMGSTGMSGASGDNACVAYQASIAGNTSADNYTATVTYIAAPVF